MQKEQNYDNKQQKSYCLPPPKEFPLSKIILTTVLAFSLLLASCGNRSTGGGGSGESDTWTNVTDISQLNGTWKTSGTFTANGITATYTNYTVTFNSAAKTMTVSGTAKATFSNLSDSDWSGVKSDLSSSVPAGVTPVFDDTNHSITVTYNNYTQTIPDDDVTGFQINQDGKKLKFQDAGVEIIFTKQ
jgi:hypothetical protein